MINIPEEIMYFLRDQGFVIVSTINSRGKIHCAAKDVISIEPEGRVILIDLYCNNTYKNLTRNPTVSITSVDEHRFMGFTLQGKAKLISSNDIKEEHLNKWEDKIIKRISSRVIKGVQAGMKSKKHYEIGLPRHPKYLIEIDVENIIDLAKPLNKPAKEAK